MRLLRHFACFIVAASAVTAQAEINPSAYDELERTAPELLKLEIVASTMKETRVKCPEYPGAPPSRSEKITTAVRLKAKVLEAIRSKSGLEPGAVIRVEYSSLEPCPGWAGALPPSPRKKGEILFAFLSKGTKSFEPAVYGRSFQKERPKR